MIDTRAVAQEVQDQLLAAVHRGHEQFRKGQEQVRRGRDTVTVAIRTGNELAKAVKPNLPTLPVPSLRVPSLTELTAGGKLRASAQELADQVAATQRKLAGNAQEVAGQMLATQRKFTVKAVQVASPLLAEGVARLTGSLAPGRRTEHPEPLAHVTKKAEPAAGAKHTASRARTSTAKASTPRASTPKAATAKTKATATKSAKAKSSGRPGATK